MRPEEKIETQVCDEAKAAGWIHRKLAFVGVRGAADRLFGKDRRTVVIEFKAPGEHPTRQQMKRHKELRDAFGWEVYVCSDVPYGRSILGLPGG